MKDGSVKPKNTDKTISSCGIPGAADLASPTAKAEESSLKMNVDNNREKLRGTAPAKQRGGHNKK